MAQWSNAQSLNQRASKGLKGSADDGGGSTVPRSYPGICVCGWVMFE